MFYKETKLLVSSQCSGIPYSCWYLSRIRGRRNINTNARKREAWRYAARNAASAYYSQNTGSNSCYTGDHVRRLTSPIIRRDDNDNNQPEQVVDIPNHEVGVPSIKRTNVLSFTNGNEWQKQVKAENRSKKATFPASRFDVELSTEQNYGCFGSDKHKFYGEFSDIRRSLDYTFHSNYVKERQLFQDDIIIQTLEDPIITDLHGNTCARPEYPWLVFTAGAMGAGEFRFSILVYTPFHTIFLIYKLYCRLPTFHHSFSFYCIIIPSKLEGKSYTIDRLVEKGRFPLTAFVRVDPDEIRRQMPEFQEYLMEESTRNIAGELTRKEAGYICEILTAAALREGKNVRTKQVSAMLYLCS